MIRVAMSQLPNKQMEIHQREVDVRKNRKPAQAESTSLKLAEIEGTKQDELSIWNNLLHSGISSPINSCRVPASRQTRCQGNFLFQPQLHWYDLSLQGNFWGLLLFRVDGGYLLAAGGRKCWGNHWRWFSRQNNLPNAGADHCLERDPLWSMQLIRASTRISLSWTWISLQRLENPEFTQNSVRTLCVLAFDTDQYWLWFFPQLLIVFCRQPAAAGARFTGLPGQACLRVTSRWTDKCSWMCNETF